MSDLTRFRSKTLKNSEFENACV